MSEWIFYLWGTVLKILTILERNSILQKGLPVCHEYTVAIRLCRRLSPEMYALTYFSDALCIIYIYISNNGHHSLTLMAKRFEYYHTILLNEVEGGGGGGVYWFHLVRLSPCPSVRLSVSPSVDSIVSDMYLQHYSPDPFHIYTSYRATSDVSHVIFSKIQKFWTFGEFFKFVALTLSCFDLFDLWSNMNR